MTGSDRTTCGVEAKVLSEIPQRISHSPQSFRRKYLIRASSYYSVVKKVLAPVGLVRFELTTPRLSSVCSNQLSYRPGRSLKTEREGLIELLTRDRPAPKRRTDSRKEVIQPQVPLRLPCYDFTPVTSHSLGTTLPCGLGKPLLEQLTPMV